MNDHFTNELIKLDGRSCHDSSGWIRDPFTIVHRDTCSSNRMVIYVHSTNRMVMKWCSTNRTVMKHTFNQPNGHESYHQPTKWSWNIDSTNRMVMKHTFNQPSSHEVYNQPTEWLRNFRSSNRTVTNDRSSNRMVVKCIFIQPWGFNSSPEVSIPVLRFQFQPWPWGLGGMNSSPQIGHLAETLVDRPCAHSLYSYWTSKSSELFPL